MTDVEGLLAEIANEPPCGPDLEYDPDFMALDQAAQGKPEQQFGTTIIAAEEPDWAAVRGQAEALFKRTKDLRVAALLVRSWIRTEGFEALTPGLTLVTQLLSRYWDGIHPRLDPDDDNDPTMRMNALAPLADSAALVRDVRESVLARPRGLPPLLVRDLEIALGKVPPKAGVAALSQAAAEGALAEAGAERLTGMIDTAPALKALIKELNERVGIERAPDLKVLYSVVQVVAQMATSVRTAIGGDPVVEAGEGAVEEAGQPAPEAPKPARGEITTRQDAVLMLDKIIAYLERTEPANPAPLLLRRAHRLMTMSFVDIIKDLAPESLAKIEALSGLPSANAK
ncbi:MAG: type VI secretion system protein TssA [Zoogloeaceae bacterium]|nr:type VI secretion system protein TssA [Zoogloeaceae bacterium]